jgi:hypothetical protein
MRTTGAQMARFLAAILFTICVAAPSVRADSITYSVTEQFTKQTPTEEDVLWSFTGPQNFALLDTLVPAQPYRLSPGEKPGDWFYLGLTQQIFISGGQSPVSFPGLTFGTWGTFGHIEKRCWPNCPMQDTDGQVALTFDTSLPSGYDQYIGGSVIGDPPPTATPEPSDLLLFGTGVIGLGFVRKFTLRRR